MNIYQEHIMDHYRKPRHYGAMANADKVVEQTNPLCGDKLKLYTRTSLGTVHYAFEGQGCAISLAAASMLGEMIDGQPIDDVYQVTDNMMLEEIGVPLSPSRMKCGLLALSGLRRSIIR